MFVYVVTLPTGEQRRVPFLAAACECQSARGGIIKAVAVKPTQLTFAYRKSEHEEWSDWQ